MTPTAEQLAILDFAKRETQSLIISADPGSGKTSTLVLVAHAVPLQPILCIAFNKRIVEEMSKRMPGHCKCVTLNGAGHRAWASTIGKRLTLNTSKTYELVKDEIDKLKGAEKSEAREAFGSIMRGVSIAKSSGYVPTHYVSVSTPLVTDLDELGELIAPAVDDNLSWKALQLISRVMERSITMGYNGEIDFDDQIYLPTLFNGSFQKYPLGLLDEVQDFSLLNHAMIEAMKFDRVIAVGDPWQSIYAFRGADRSSMAKLKKTFNMKEMRLSISFRCPKRGVELARARSPDMKWHDSAIDGEVYSPEQWSAKDVPDNAVVLCRNNAPLFALALRLIRAGRGVHLVGRELGPGLIKVLKKLGPLTLERDRVLVAIDAWQAEALAKARQSARATIVDRADCLRVFADFGSNLDEAISYAEHIFALEGLIKLMSIHKAKGLEFDEVLHLDGWRIPSKFAKIALEQGDEGPMDQELNLRHVAVTRWKKRLINANLAQMQ